MTPMLTSGLRRLAEGPRTAAWLAAWAECDPGEHQRLMQPLPSIVHLQPHPGIAGRDDLRKAIQRESNRQRSREGPLHPLSSAAIAAMLGMGGPADHQAGWAIAAPSPQNPLLCLAGQMRAISLPPGLRGIDLALAGAAVEHLSRADLAALSWLLELHAALEHPAAASRGRSREEPAEPAHLVLEEALQGDLWIPLLPSSCFASAASSAARSLANRLDAVPGAGGNEEMSWPELIWDPAGGKLPPNVEIEEHDPAAKRLLELLGQLHLGELPEHGHGAAMGHYGEISLCWGPWRGTGAPGPLSMAMAVMPAEGYNPGRRAPSAQIEIAFARRDGAC